MEYNTDYYSWICKQCNTSPKDNKVMVGIDHCLNLVAKWYCSKCRGAVLARIPLEELMRNCPSAPETISNEITEEDRKLLAMAHIVWED